MYRITGFGEPTDYETLAQAQADIRSMGDEWANVELVEDTDGNVFDVSEGQREHVGDNLTAWATRMAEYALGVVAVGEPESVADMTVLHMNADGTYTVEDNGEEVAGLDRENAIRVIVENLTA